MQENKRDELINIVKKSIRLLINCFRETKDNLMVLTITKMFIKIVFHLLTPQLSFERLS